MGDDTAIEIAQVPIVAVSVGGMETCIEVPTWKLCFDIGRCPPTAHRWGRVLFTHAHVDHLGGIASHCATRDLLGMPPPAYYVPAENHADLLALLDAWRRLDRSGMPCAVHAASPGDAFPVGPGREAIAFRAVHRVPALGWGLWRTKKRLRPEFAGVDGVRLGELRKQGVPIEDEVRTPEIAFCGDTTIDVLEREQVVRTARVLILEVTFLDDQVSVEASRRMGHVHLDEVIARAALFENEAILFTHFSLRHGPKQIRDVVRHRLPAGLRERVSVLVPRAPWTP